MTGSRHTGDEEGLLSRRQLLLSGGVGLAGGVLGSLLVRETPDAPVSAHDAEPVAEQAPGVSESEFPYAVWQYHYDSDGDRNSLSVASPINVVFPLENAEVEDVVETFVAAGWTSSPLEYTLWAWDRVDERYRRPHWSSAETFFGLGGRLHVRLWNFEGTASVQAHVDSAVIPQHEVTSYAEAQFAVERIFESAGWHVDGTIDLENDTPPDHDGTASVIQR